MVHIIAKLAHCVDQMVTMIMLFMVERGAEEHFGNEDSRFVRKKTKRCLHYGYVIELQTNIHDLP